MTATQPTRNAPVNETDGGTRHTATDRFDGVRATLSQRSLSSEADSHLPQHLGRELRQALDDVTVTVRTGSQECDILVDDTVGVEIVDGLAAYGHAGLRRHLETVGRDCEYLVVFVHALPNDNRDAWWLLRKRCTPRALGVHDIAFVKPDNDGPVDGERSPLTAWLLIGPAVLFVLGFLATSITEATAIASHPMLLLIVPVIGLVGFLAILLKCFGNA